MTLSHTSDPAKFSRALIRRIYQHAKAEGWIGPGSVVLDPFGGVGLGALDALLAGCSWTGIELEQKFVDLGNQNLVLWQRKFGSLPIFGSAVLLQGDSRNSTTLFRSPCIEEISDAYQKQDSTTMCDMRNNNREEPQRSQSEDGQSLLLETMCQDREGPVDLSGTEGELSLSREWQSKLSLSSRARISGKGKSQLQERSNSRQELLQETEEGSMRALRDNKEAGRASQEQQSLRQPLGKSGDSLSLLSHARDDEGKDGGKESWIIVFPKQRSDRVDVIKGQVDCVVASPPYADQGQQSGSDTPARLGILRNGVTRGGSTRFQYGKSPGQLGEMKAGQWMVISSPPYASGEKGHSSLGSVNKDNWGNDGRDIARRSGLTGEYGREPGQLANLPVGQFEIIVSSPPFLQQERGGGLAKLDAVYSGDGHHFGAHGYQNQGETTGQLANLPEGPFDLVCSSPPYAETMNDPHDGIKWRQAKTEGGSENHRRGKSICGEYGRSEGQLGNTQGDTFWSAAKQILEGCHLLLKPGGHAIWVLKMFVRQGKIVDFPSQWRQLCESVGFITLHEHHAMLVSEGQEQLTFSGGSERKRTERKSFFRRLHEKKHPETVINFETIFCMRKEPA